MLSSVKKFFAQLSFKKARNPLIAATVTAAIAIGSAAIIAATVVTAAETTVRAEEQEAEDYDPEALIVLK